MNKLSPFVETVIKHYSHTALQQLYHYLVDHPGTTVVQGFGCAQNEAYVLKRLINAALSRDADIKFNAYFALSTILNFIPNLKEKINSTVLGDYILSQSNIQKNCGGKPSQIQAYSIGRILIVKGLHKFLIDNVKIINNLIDLNTKFPELEEQIIEVIFLLVKGKKSQLVFSKINPNTKSGFILFTILRAEIKQLESQINQPVVNDVINQLVTQYPKRSVCLSYLGKQLAKKYQWGQQYLAEKMKVAFNNLEENIDFKLIFYLLQLLQSYLANTTITRENVWKLLKSNIIEGWLSQLKVQNKYIRRQAQNIHILFENDSQMAFDILKKLHDQKVNLANMNIKHPLFTLLQIVEPEKYIHHLLQICTKTGENINTEYLSTLFPENELQLFVSVFHKNLKAESIAKVIELFVHFYMTGKDDKHLQKLNRVFNSILPENHKKKQHLLQKQSLILIKFNFEQIQFGQFEQELKEAFKDIRKKFKEAKQQEQQFIVSYFNFLVSVGYYLLMHPEEVEVYSDLKMAYADIKKNILNEFDGLAPKKKRKLNDEDQRNKPIHILIDVFISLLTKSPHFLRNSINRLFEHVIPFITSEDIGHLLQVLDKPDQEYLEQVQNQ